MPTLNMREIMMDRKRLGGIVVEGCCFETSLFSKKQTLLLYRTTEAVIRKPWQRHGQQSQWMKQALIDYTYDLTTVDDVTIMCDNKGAIDLSKNPMQHSRTKHIEIRHHFLRDNVQKGHISVEKVSHVDNIADILTKPLKRESFNYLSIEAINPSPPTSLYIPPPSLDQVNFHSEFCQCCLDTRDQVSNLFDTLLNIVNDNIALAFMSTSKLNDSILWHARLGHVYFKRMQDMSKDGLILAFDMDTKKCKTFILNIISLKPFQNVKCETEVLELIHSDLCDLHATHSLGNKKYFMTFIDDASRAVVRLPDPKLKLWVKKALNESLLDLDMLKILRILVLRPSLRILNGTEDIGGLVVPEEVTKEDDPKTFDEAMKSQDVAF
ncbi:zinc finger, CCHC-type containing protein [Tanacetum coccineum]